MLFTLFSDFLIDLGFIRNLKNNIIQICRISFIEIANFIERKCNPSRNRNEKGKANLNNNDILVNIC